MEPLVTPKGEPIGAPTTVDIGALGGTLASADGRLSVEVPAGALEETIAITVLPVSSWAPGGNGEGYRLSPSGVEFLKPVTLRFKYDDDDLAGSFSEALVAATQLEDGTWRALTDVTLDMGARTVAVETTHFSDWSLSKQLVLLPAVAEVSPGDSLQLELQYCFVRRTPRPDPDDAADYDPKGYRCGEASESFDSTVVPVPPVRKLGSITVDGVPGGDSVVGTVTTGTAWPVYRAPDQVPEGGMVTVTVSVELPVARERHEASARITISEGNAYALDAQIHSIRTTESGPPGERLLEYKGVIFYKSPEIYSDFYPVVVESGEVTLRTNSTWHGGTSHCPEFWRSYALTDDVSGISIVERPADDSGPRYGYSIRVTAGPPEYPVLSCRNMDGDAVSIEVNDVTISLESLYCLTLEDVERIQRAMMEGEDPYYAEHFFTDSGSLITGGCVLVDGDTETTFSWTVRKIDWQP